MSHSFFPPSSFKLINCQQVPGERARKDCRKWNSLIRKRNKCKNVGHLDEVKEIEEQLRKFL